MFSIRKKKKDSQTIDKKSFQRFFILHYGSLLLTLIILVVAAGFYFIFSLTYSSLIVPEEINPTDVVIEKKKINITQYEATYEALQQKQEGTAEKTVPQIFNRLDIP